MTRRQAHSTNSEQFIRRADRFAYPRKAFAFASGPAGAGPDIDRHASTDMPSITHHAVTADGVRQHCFDADGARAVVPLHGLPEAGFARRIIGGEKS
ncbi:hypothetical protein [Burkholderia territorii]|uniref:hypothetical protein n=1 Tax=Burkholderia territorii TaxID=1503055 RepID=UPI00075F6077|nr:hypothetical protein [Burkholderia territorii]